MKKNIKFIIPIVLCIAVIAVIYNYKAKNTAVEKYIKYEDEPTAKPEEKHRVRVGVKTEYSEETTEDGVAISIGDSDAKTIVSDDKILYKDSDGEVSMVSISELLDGHEPTNNNTKITITKANKESGIVEDMGYDTDIVYRTVTYASGNTYDEYSGYLFGQYHYCFSKNSKEKYNIDKYMVISSYFNNDKIILDYDANEEKTVYMERGSVIIQIGEES